MRKRSLFFLSLLFVLTLALLPGCSNSSDGDTIKIGANFELTGGVASFGQSAVNAIELAFEQVNADGGVLGKQLELVIADNKSDASESTMAMTKLVTQDKVSAVLGPVTSTNTLAAVPVAQDNKVPMITPTATNPKVTVNEETGKLNDYVFRSCFIDPFQGTVMANFASNDLDAKTAAIYIDNSSDYAKGLAKYFKESFEANGGTIVAEEAYVAKDTDFKATLTRIKSTNPDVIFVPGYYEEVGKIVKQGRELGITVPFLGGDGWDAPQMLDIAGAENLNNTYFSNHYSAEDPSPEIQNFVKAYEEKYNATPDALAALGYDAALLLIDAIKRAGSDDPEKIRDALEETKDFPAVSGKITFDENHNPVKSAVIIEFKDGKQTYKTSVNP